MIEAFPYSFPYSLEVVLHDVAHERHRQDQRFGAERNLHPGLWFAVLSEEVGEVAEHVIGSFVGRGMPLAEVREELVQVAAVAVAFAEWVDRALQMGGPANWPGQAPEWPAKELPT